MAASDNINKSEFFAAIALMEKEKGIPAAYLCEKIAAAIVVSVKRDYGGKDVVFCEINPETEDFKVYVRKTAVEEVEDPDTEIQLDEAKTHNKKAKLDQPVEIKINTRQFGRIAAQTTKHVIRQGIREAERGQVLQEFQSRQQELVTALVQRVDPRTGNATVEIGRAEAVLPQSEQVEGETLREGDHIKVYIVDVKSTEKGPRVTISRTHPGLVRRLFELEVPEIYEGTVEIKSVSREAGSRTKLAVWSKDENVDAVGACIGQRGARVNKIIEELDGEKIDVIKFSEDPAAFITESLSPAKVVGVELDADGAKACKVTVPDAQLSLAIGNRGQNARLAARLTGWKIDIRPESGFYGE